MTKLPIIKSPKWGSNEAAQLIRDALPEPSRTKRMTASGEFLTKTILSPRKYHFRKCIAILHREVSIYAWLCVEDKCIYI